MNVKEALKDIFKINFDSNDTIHDWGLYSNDKKTLNNNLHKDVVFLDHLGKSGVLVFNQRKNIKTVFLFNLPGNSYHRRLFTVDNLSEWFTFKDSVLNSKNFNITNVEFDTWLALKTIEGGRF